MEWYYADSGQQAGPITESELQSLYLSGKIRHDTLVWRPGLAGWQPFSQAQPQVAAPAAEDGQFCTNCGKPYATSELIAFGASRVCANCKDAFFQRVREQGSEIAIGPAFLLYAGFWIRLVAVMIDGLILGIFFFVVALIAALLVGKNFLTALQNPNLTAADIGFIYGGIGLFYLIFFAASITYQSWFVARRGGTPGKLALGLKIVRSDGTALTLGRSVGRAFAYILNNLVPFGLGFIIAGLDNQKRALHDHICDTRVIRKAA
ncbi:MAG: RDD family protein [Acidobacteriaceae bacterium]|nr:RDD family protein [Acidobacteriaceae bacterium]